MKHAPSPSDNRFRDEFSAGLVPPAGFDHRAHVRLAYIFLTRHDTEEATELMRSALFRFLEHHGIDAGKYHETMTRSWILAVRHFMERTPAAGSADQFIDANPVLLDSKIMLTHYSADVLFSPEARAGFVEPDVQAIPRHAD